MWGSPTTLIELLDSAAGRASDRTAFTYCEDGASIDDQATFAEFHSRVSTVAAALGSSHSPGERIMLLPEPGLGFPLGFFACAWAGLVPVAAQPPGMGRLAAGLDRLAAIAADCDASGVLCSGELFRLKEVAESRPALRALCWHTIDDLAWSNVVSAAPRPTKPDALAFIQTTSGSAAAPKGVMLTHRNLVEQARLLREITRQDEQSVSVTWAPLFHDMGLSSAVLLPLSVPYHSLLMSPFSFVQRPARWLRAIFRERATLAGGPNFAYELLLRSVTMEERATLDLSSWGFAFVGAEPIRARTIERFTRAFSPVGFRSESWYCCWGLAEATCVSTGRPRGSGARIRWFDPSALTHDGKLAARSAGDQDADAHVGCGAALPGHELVVVDPDDRVALPRGRVGELWLRGPCVGSGYWGKPDDESFSAALVDGRGPFLRTGDLGAIDDNGEVFVVGRLKEMILVRGRNLAPQDIEATAEGAHPVAEPGLVAAFSVDDGVEERVVVVQGIRRLLDADVEEVREALQSAVAGDHGITCEVVLVRARAIPRTASGKVRRAACREAYVSGTLELIDTRVASEEPVWTS